METDPQEWKEIHIGENRTDPAVQLVNITPEQDYEQTPEAQS